MNALGNERRISEAGEMSKDHGLKLLVIEDDLVQRMFVREVAEPMGFSVDEAATLDQAYERLEACAFDTIVVDLALGSNDGVEAIRRIVASGRHPDIIVMSGFDHRIRDAVARMAGANGLTVIGDLKKPVKPGEMRRCLAGATERADRKATLHAASKISRDALAGALAKSEIVPRFQPQVSLATGEIAGIEVIAGWIGTLHADASPDMIAACAEAEGLAIQLTDRMLEGALREGRQWCEAREDLVIAVSVPPSVLTDLKFPDGLASRVKEAGMRPENLIIEVTEGAALTDMAVTSDVMARLSIKGFGLALDDFGTGFGSLSLLRNFPFGQIRIHRSFVADLHRSTSAWSIIKGTVAMAEATGLVTIATGVETRVAADALASAGVDFGQGQLYGGPATPDQISSLLGI